jgi:predicted component of type VI protein secretion system
MSESDQSGSTVGETGADDLRELDARARCLLLVMSEDGASRTLELPAGGEVTIGRDEGATVRVDEEKVSRLHARIFRRDDAVIVEDCKSRNGTRVNDAKLVNARQELVGGNRIRIGSTEILVAIVRALPPIKTADARDPAHSIIVADRCSGSRASRAASGACRPRA